MTVLEMSNPKKEKLLTVFSIKESQIQRAIMDLLAAEHVFALRLNTSSQLAYDANGKSRMIRSHSGGKGVADILAFLPTSDDFRLQRVLWIEVKRSQGKQTLEQLSFQAYVEGLGHYYLLATSSEEVLDWLKSYRSVS